MPCGEIEVDVHSIGDLLRQGHRLVVFGERFVHLLGRFDEELVALQLHTSFIRDDCSRVDAQQDVVRLGVVAVEVVRVVGGDQGDPGSAGDIDGSNQALLLNPQSGVLDLEVEVLAKDLLVPADQLGRLVVTPGEDVVREFTRGTARETDQALAVGFENFLVDPWLVIEALQVSQ